MLLAQESSGIVVAILGTVGLAGAAMATAVAVLYKSQQQTNELLRAQYEKQQALADSKAKSWESIAIEALRKLEGLLTPEQVAAVAKVKRVKAERSSPATEAQVETAKLQTARAALEAVELALGLPSSPLDHDPSGPAARDKEEMERDAADRVVTEREHGALAKRQGTLAKGQETLAQEQGELAKQQETLAEKGPE